MKLFIDGDGSPAKDVAIEVAQKQQLPVVIVTSLDHYSTKLYPDFVSFVYVDQGADAADYKIVQLISSGDLLITQDYGLASLVLPKGAAVLHQLGYEYTSETITGLLEQRYFSGKIRQQGGRTKGPKPFTQKDRLYFRQQLVKKITEMTASDGTQPFNVRLCLKTIPCFLKLSRQVLRQGRKRNFHLFYSPTQIYAKIIKNGF